MRKLAGVMIIVVLCMPFLGWMTTRIVQDILFDRNVAGHLKRAADANTIELAKKELVIAVQYLEETGMTSGYTSILWRTPNEDVGFWYQNLKASLEELQSIRNDATQLEKTNVLMKLRETLLDEGQNVSVTVPGGASIFPHNTVYFWWAMGSLVLVVVGVIVGILVFTSGRYRRY